MVRKTAARQITGRARREALGDKDFVGSKDFMMRNSTVNAGVADKGEEFLPGRGIVAERAQHAAGCSGAQ
jgi:hypothetical protein